MKYEGASLRMVGADRTRHDTLHREVNPQSKANAWQFFLLSLVPGPGHRVASKTPAPRVIWGCTSNKANP